MGYGNSTLRTVFPVMVYSPSTPRTKRYYDNAEARTGQRILMGDRDAEVKSKTVKVKKVASSAPKLQPMAKPKYATESEVTMAVILNQIPFTEILPAYRLAKEYEKWLKTQGKKFFPKKTLATAAPTGLNWRPGYATK